MNLLLHRDPRHLHRGSGPNLEPFGLVRDLLRWEPFWERDSGLDFQSGFLPSFDIVETPEAYLFEADLPGIRQENLDIHLTGNRLTVAGKREPAERKPGETAYSQERAYGAFSRSFGLPEDVDGGQVSAELRQGVLHLALRKRPEVQSKRIAISDQAPA